VGRSSWSYEDCGPSYDPVNGGTTYTNGQWCDSTGNLFDPKMVPNFSSSCGSATDSACWGRIHVEFDRDWLAASYCGSGVCNNNTLVQNTVAGSASTLIDVQGYVYWDDGHVGDAFHQFSGWELHPLTAWRLHQSSQSSSLTAAFSYSPTSPTVGQTVTFTGTASGGTGPYSFSWNFGDGSTVSGSSAPHSYSAQGTYTVSLTVKDSASPTPNTKTVTQSLTVSQSPPSGKYVLSWQGFDWDGGGEETLTMNGKFLASLPVTGTLANANTYVGFSLDITSFAVQGTNKLLLTHANWDCGVVDSVKNLQVTNGPTVVYSNSTVEPLSCTQSLTYTFTIGPPPLATSFMFSPTSPIAGQAVTFAATGTGGTTPYSFSWNLGDGSSASGSTVTRTYSSAGSFTVTLTAKDSSSPQQSAISQRTVTVSNPSPPPFLASFTFNPSSPQVGQQVTFTASASGGTSPYAFSWSFGDGSSSLGSTAFHAYASNGTFSVLLTAKDSGSPQQTASSQQTITVASAPSALAASFAYSPSSPVVGQTVTFAASASGGTSPYTFTWSFGDGSIGTGSTTTHTYSTTGTFSVTLTVKDSGPSQQAATSQQSIRVMIPLSTSFTFTPSSPDAGQSVSFTGSASGGTSPYGYSWNFGDGGTGSGSLVKHTYQSSGTYTVGLTVPDSGGQVVATSKTITVNARPSASFTYSPSNPLPLQSITFTASATGGLQPYTYSWDFGDGSTGTGPSASHSYTLPGTYTVTLTVTDANAQTFTTSKTITVLASL
jgi:PKD repeat protein